VNARPLGWTAADEAELSVLTDALVRAGFAHRECVRCKALGAWCGPMREAAEAVLEWRHFRRLLSRAEWLRERQTSKKIP
jgi:hypothetical protein